MDRFNQLKEIIETYERFRPVMKERGISIGEIHNNGFWTPVHFRHAIYFLEYTVREGSIEASKPIVDAGSGDGRMLVLFDVYGFKPVVGIEANKKLVNFSKVVIDDLIKRSIVPDNIYIVHGNFTTSQAYEHAGVPFTDIPYFYMVINSKPLEKLAEKIQRESPNGTKLIVYGMIDEGQEPKLPLQLMSRMRTKDCLADIIIYKK